MPVTTAHHVESSVPGVRGALRLELRHDDTTGAQIDIYAYEEPWDIQEPMQYTAFSPDDARGLISVLETLVAEMESAGTH